MVTKVERIILENHLIILNSLANLTRIQLDRDNLYERFTKTKEVLNPTKSEKAYEESFKDL